MVHQAERFRAAEDGDVAAFLYHNVHADDAPGAERIDVSSRQLRAHLRALGRLPNAPDSAPQGARGAVLITFDDARTGALLAADLLEEAGWRGYFFVPVSYLGDRVHLTRAQVAELAERGHVIGSHSMSHPSRMSLLEDSALLREWSQSLSELAQIIGRRVDSISLPAGDDAPRVIRAARESGAREVFTSRPTVRTRRVEGCIIIGRYAVTRRSSASMVAAIGRRDPIAQALAWCNWSWRQSAKGLVSYAPGVWGRRIDRQKRT